MRSGPNTASMTVLVPQAMSATSRRNGYPASPFGPPRGLGNTRRFASVSGTGIWVPSIATTRRPANLAEPPAWVGAGPARKVNSSRTGPGPTRRIACVIDDFAGRGARTPSPLVSRAHTCCHPCSANRTPPIRRYTTTREGSRRSRCSLPRAASNAASTISGGTIPVNSPR